MTESNTEPPFAEGQTFEDNEGNTKWRITDIERTYRFMITRYDENGEETGEEPSRYPEKMLQSKLERGDLTVPEPELIDCPDCDYKAETEHGLKTHRGKAHGDGTADEVTEE